MLGDPLDTGCFEIWVCRPVAQFTRVAPNADPLGIRWSWAVKDEKLEPTRWGNVRVWRRRDSASIPGARHGREDGLLTHTITVRTGDGAE